MVISSSDKAYKKLLKSGSVLKGLRKRMGGGLGCIVGGLILVGTGLLLYFMFRLIGMAHQDGLLFLGFFGILGLPLVLIGIIFHNRRVRMYLSFYQKAAGFSETELHRVEEELASPDVYITAIRRTGAGKKDRFVSCIITDSYLVTDNYIRRIDDLFLAAFTDTTPAWWIQLLTRNGSTPVFGIIVLSKADDDAYFIGFNTVLESKEEICTDIIDELHRRNPEMLRTVRLLCDGREFNLLKDCKEVLRLYREGHSFTEKSSTIIIGGKAYKSLR